VYAYIPLNYRIDFFSLFLSFFSTLQEPVEVKNNNPLLTTVSLCLLLTLSALFPTAGLCSDAVKAQQWEITADKLTRYENPPSVIAEGNVILEKIEKVTRTGPQPTSTDWSDLLGDDKKPADSREQSSPKEITTSKIITTIKADWMVYDMDLGTVKARGNLIIDVGPDKLSAEEGVVNLNQETGTFTNATIIRQYKDMHFEGRVIEKTGDVSYHIEDGWLITCKLKEGETPPWSFGAAEADITDGGYAFLKHAVFRIKDIPVLYTPIMILPAKRNRQTGFLFPSVSASDRDGFGMEIPFFINLSPNSDITLYPQYMAKRGFMGGLEGRYVLDRNSKGSFMANFLHDELSDINDPDNDDYYSEGNFTHTNQDRYWIRGKADQDIGAWTTRLDLDIVSDRDYLTEFNSGLTGFTMTNNRFLDEFGRSFQNSTEDLRKNSFRALRSWNNGMFLQANVQGINDLRFEKTMPSPLWKLPEINFSGLLPLYDSGIDLSWNTDYVYYWRDQGVGAHRFDLFPRITGYIPLSDYLETTFSAGVRDTFYSIQNNGDPDWEDSSTENRFLGDLRAEIGTTMVRDFNITAGSVTGLQHTFRPYVNYRYISDTDQDDLPQFDSVDDVGDQNLITYGLDNFFTLSGTNQGRSYEREYGYIKIRQGYDFSSSQSDTPWTPLNMRLAYYPLQNLRLIYRMDYDVYGEGFTKHIAEGNYRNSRGDLFSFDYLYNKNETTYLDDDGTEITGFEKTSSIRASMRVGLFYYFSAGYSIERSLEDSKTVAEKFNLIYHPSCWSVELASDYTGGDQKITLMFQLANIGSPFGMDMPGL
jgi:LPS-assembly protein